MWAFYHFERIVFKNVLKILLINIWFFIPLLVYMWGVEGVTLIKPLISLITLSNGISSKSYHSPIILCLQDEAKKKKKDSPENSDLRTHGSWNQNLVILLNKAR